MFQRVFFILTALLFLLRFIFLIQSRYGLWIEPEAWKFISPYLLSGYLIELLLTILSLIALLGHTPAKYLLFMIAPFQLWVSGFLIGFGSHWTGIILFGIIIPFVFNLNFIRTLYIKQKNLWLSKLLQALAIGAFLGAFPLLFR